MLVGENNPSGKSKSIDSQLAHSGVPFLEVVV